MWEVRELSHIGTALVLSDNHAPSHSSESSVLVPWAAAPAFEPHTQRTAVHVWNYRHSPTDMETRDACAGRKGAQPSYAGCEERVEALIEFIDEQEGSIGELREAHEYRSGSHE